MAGSAIVSGEYVKIALSIVSSGSRAATCMGTGATGGVAGVAAAGVVAAALVGVAGTMDIGKFDEVGE